MLNNFLYAFILTLYLNSLGHMLLLLYSTNVYVYVTVRVKCVIL